MANIWCVSAPLFGHLDWGGFLKTAQALQAQGHTVRWVSQAPILPFVEKKGLSTAVVPVTGWLWPPPPAPDLTTIMPHEAMFLRYKRALDTWLSTDLVIEGTQALLDLADEIGAPDVIVTDPFLTASALAAEKMNVPLAVCGWPAMPDLDENNLYYIQRDLADESQKRLSTILEAFNLKGENFSRGATPGIQSPHLHISYFSRYWHQADPHSLPQTHFVGGQAETPTTPTPTWFEHLPDNKPLVLITLGSVFTGDLGFFAWAAQGAHQSGMQPIVVIGYTRLEPVQKAELKAALPAGTIMLNWVDFDHIMPRLSTIVHHGGMGTTHAALLHGVPQVIVPHAADQRSQAVRASNAKVGLNLTAHDVQRGQLRPAINAIAKDAKVKDTCVKMAAKFTELGGPTKAAELIAELVN